MNLDLITVEGSTSSDVLYSKAIPVSFPLSLEDAAFAHALEAKFLEIKGVGLAAPQVGINKQIFVIGIDESAKALRHDGMEVIPTTLYFNAIYEPLSDAKLVYDWEACFSVECTMAKVPRYDAIAYTACDLNGKTISAIAYGFTARVLQHEIDHTHGILFIDRLDNSSISGHPDEMMAKRIEEFDINQLLIFEKSLDNILNCNPPHPKIDVYFKLKDKVHALLELRK